MVEYTYPVHKQSLFLIKCSQMFISCDSMVHSEGLWCVEIRWLTISILAPTIIKNKILFVDNNAFFSFMYNTDQKQIRSAHKKIGQNAHMNLLSRGHK